MKFATMDLIGLPYQIVIGSKRIQAGEVEVKSRQGEMRVLNLDQVAAYLEGKLHG